MTKEVATKDEAKLPAGLDMDQLKQDASDLNPEMDTGDVALPYIYILQANSPQVNPGRSEYVEGAQASMFFNNVADAAFEARTNGLMFVPCAYERRYVEWVHRDNGGGWVADYPVTSNILENTRPDEMGKPRLPNGNVIVETAYHYGLVLDPETGVWSQCVLPMKSTALKKNRAWNNALTTTKIPGTDIQAPRFLYAYNLQTEMETKGENSWWNFKITKHEEPVSSEVYANAKAFAELVTAGSITRVAEPGVGTSADGTKYDEETGEVLDENGNFKE